MSPDTAWTVPGYTEVRELGRGGSGRVILSTHDETGTPVAIKYLDDELRADETYLREFRAEARLIAEVDSPNVARLYEYVESDAGAAIVMELVNGVSLRAMLREHGPTEPEAALCVLKGSLLGLAAAHAHNVVHRDYKPENVLVDGVGSSKLADFGIAVRVGRTAVVAGTPAYMAPEQWAGGPASPATDIYAASVTFYECLTGKRPYQGDLNSVRRQHEQAPIPLEDAPPVLHGLLRSGLAKEPGRRPGDALAFLADLESTARFGYGEDWESRGRGKLAQRAALLAALWPLAGSVVGGSALATTVLGASLLKRIVVSTGIAIVVGTATVASCIELTPPPASGGGPVAIGTPISTFPATATATASPSATASPTPATSQTPPPPPKTTSQPPPPPPPVPPPPPATKVTDVTVRVVLVPGAGQPRYRASLIVKTSGTKPVTITVRFFGTTGFRGSPEEYPQTYQVTLSGKTQYTNVPVPGTGGYTRPRECASTTQTYEIHARATTGSGGPTDEGELSC